MSFTLHHTAPGGYTALLPGTSLHFSQGLVFADAGFGECLQVDLPLSVYSMGDALSEAAHGTFYEPKPKPTPPTPSLV